MSKETAIIVVSLLAALIAATVPALRHEIRRHTRAPLSDLAWAWNPDGRHMGTFDRAVWIYKNGATAAVVVGGIELAMCYFFMAGLAIILGTHPSLPVIGLMMAAGLALWMYVPAVAAFRAGAGLCLFPRSPAARCGPGWPAAAGWASAPCW